MWCDTTNIVFRTNTRLFIVISHLNYAIFLLICISLIMNWIALFEICLIREIIYPQCIFIHDDMTSRRRRSIVPLFLIINFLIRCVRNKIYLTITFLLLNFSLWGEVRYTDLIKKYPREKKIDCIYLLNQIWIPFILCFRINALRNSTYNIQNIN